MFVDIGLKFEVKVIDFDKFSGKAQVTSQASYAVLRQLLFKKKLHDYHTQGLLCSVLRWQGLLITSSPQCA